MQKAGIAKPHFNNVQIEVHEDMKNPWHPAKTLIVLLHFSKMTRLSQNPCDYSNVNLIWM